MTPVAPPRAVVLAAAAACTALVLAGCGGGSPAPVATSSPLPTSAAPSTPAPTTSPSASVSTATPRPSPSTPAAFRGTYGPVVRAGMPTPASLLTAIQVAHHPGYDRVVLEFDGPLPGYRIAYVRQVLEDPSGQVVPLEGDARLQVTLHGATADTTSQAGAGETPRRYAGPRQMFPELRSVEEIRVVGDFEAVLSVGIGVDHQVPFRVSALSAPTRLVLDFAVD